MNRIKLTKAQIVARHGHSYQYKAMTKRFARKFFEKIMLNACHATRLLISSRDKTKIQGWISRFNLRIIKIM
jgi:hypothetical protein